MKDIIGYIIATIAILLITAVIIYWLFCIHTTVGIIGIGVILSLIAGALLSD